MLARLKTRAVGELSSNAEVHGGTDCRALPGLDPADLLLEPTLCITTPSASETKLLERLETLRERLAVSRFQLAALGQFKRGKSMLLNALLGADVLPTGVIPVTAIPTFLQFAPGWRLRVTFGTVRTEQSELDGPSALRERLAEIVTEAANPHNRLGVTRVDVFLPSAFLAQGVVLVDTPGVGSTFQHNTAAADAVLPECDAALFVVSPDPPISEVEVEFLARIRKTVARLIIVLNKIDTLESEDRVTAAAFLRRVLSEQECLELAVPIFCLSGRAGLRARLAGDAHAIAETGLLELEAHLAQFLAHEKLATLRAAVARKASALVGELQLEREFQLKALSLPLEDVEGVLLRNVENLRWATRQNIEDTFRRFRAELDERLALSLVATRGAMVAARDARKQQTASIEPEIQSTRVALSRLSEIQVALGCISRESE